MHEQYGQKLYHDPTWKGPLHRRQCTDIFWLIVFIVFLFGWSYVAFYAFKNGNVEKLIAPADSEGRKCGVDEEVINKPYLIFFDLSKCAKVRSDYRCPTTQVCIEKCPTQNFLFDAFKLNTTVGDLKKMLICKIEVNLANYNDIDQLQRLVDNEKCTRWYINSTSIIHRCVPRQVWDGFGNKTIESKDLEKAKEFIETVAKVEDTMKKVYHDVKATKKFIMILAIVTAVISLVYIVSLRWIATPCVYATIGFVIGLLAFATYEASKAYAKSKEQKNLIILIVSAVLLVIIILTTLFLRKRINLACQIIKEASKAVTHSLTSLVFPIIPWALLLVVVLFGITVFVLLFTIYQSNHTVDMMNDGCICDSTLKYVANATCDPKIFNEKCKTAAGGPCPLSSCKLNKEMSRLLAIFHVVNLVGFYWLICFISAFGDMVLSATFATWYWTFDKRKVPFFTITVSMWRTIRYHLGTLAFGALILTICKIIRLIIEAINQQVKKANNQLATAIACCCSCLFSLLESFLKFINTNAYIMCAVHGKGFCSSARAAFNLLMRNIVRVYVVNKITSWLLELGKLLIVGLTVAVTWWYFTSPKNEAQVNYWVVPAVVIGIASYLITTVFFKVHTVAIDTLFLCFLEDSERNDGTDERPYFMSKNLRKLLHK